MLLWAGGGGHPERYHSSRLHEDLIVFYWILQVFAFISLCLKSLNAQLRYRFWKTVAVLRQGRGHSCRKVLMGDAVIWFVWCPPPILEKGQEMFESSGKFWTARSAEKLNKHAFVAECFSLTPRLIYCSLCDLSLTCRSNYTQAPSLVSISFLGVDGDTQAEWVFTWCQLRDMARSLGSRWHSRITSGASDVRGLFGSRRAFKVHVTGFRVRLSGKSRDFFVCIILIIVIQ